MVTTSYRLRDREVASLLGCCKASVWNWAKTLPGFPQPKKEGKGFTYWLRPEIEAYMNKHNIKPSDPKRRKSQRSFSMPKQVSLLGMSFLYFSEEGHVEWQGDIIGIDGELCICQLYEWIAGEESDCVVIHKMEFANPNRFRLFKSYEERKEAYRNRYQHITLEKGPRPCLKKTSSPSKR